MYSFVPLHVGPLLVHLSLPRAGDAHKKNIAPGVTPQTQKTLNVYVEGDYTIEYADGTTESFAPGSCSLDVQRESLPAGICVETSAGEGRRLCIEAQDAPMDWVAEDLAAGDSRALDGYVVVMSGEVEVDGVARYPGFVGAAASVAALTPARIVVIQGEPEPT